MFTSFINRVKRHFLYPKAYWKSHYYVNEKKLKQYFYKFQKKKKCFDKNWKAPIKIAVIVPCFKHEKYLETALNSIISQKEKVDEIIIINDASPDSSIEVIDNFIKTHTQNFNIKFINNQDNLGQSLSINKAVISSNSTHFIILNDDDILMPYAVTVIKSAIQKNLSVGLIGGTFLELVEDMDYSSLVNNTLISKGLNYEFIEASSSLYFKHTNDFNIAHSGSCFSKFAWEVVGGYYKKKHHRVCAASDRDFQLRINLVYDIIKLDLVLCAWRNYSSVDGSLYS
jgi:glycosyltransferase involved in cell wall biosynthesis